MSLQSAQDTRQRSLASNAWMILIGWTLVRLVTLGGRPKRAAAYPGPATSGQPADRRQATGFGGPKQHVPQQAAQASTGPSSRGREADKPTEIPAKGWKDILWRVYERTMADRVMLVAAGVTFYALLAIFPAITALVSIYGLFSDPASIESQISALSGILPGGAVDIISEQVKRIASTGAGTLGFSFFIGLAVALWSANAGMKSIFDALNIVYEEEEKRSFLKLNAISMLFTVSAILFLVVALGIVVVVPVILSYLGLGDWAQTLVSILRWPALLVGIVLGLALIYRYGPSRDNAKWRWITPGSIAASVLWLAVSMLFSWYVANFGSYNKTYGSLGAAIGFMTWIWLSTIVVLVGAEINAQTEHQTRKDSTEGPHEPMGSRGATMADTLGEKQA